MGFFKKDTHQDTTPKADLEKGLAAFFTADHRDCDMLWSQVESAIDAGDGPGIKEAWQTFHRHMLRHLAMEEEVIFPAFERVTGMTQGGPTFVMRSEHQQMRGLMSHMATLVEAEAYDEVLGQGDTLLMLTQQHNVKEEGMLYPMADGHLTGQWPMLKADLIKLDVT